VAVAALAANVPAAQAAQKDGPVAPSRGWLLPAGQLAAAVEASPVPAAVAQYLPAEQGAHDLAPPAVEARVPMGQISVPRVTILAPVTDRVPPQATWVVGLGSVVALYRERAASEPDLATLTMEPELQNKRWGWRI
jgi:hypothetical protein